MEQRRIAIVSLAGDILTEIHPLSNTDVLQARTMLEEQELRDRGRIVRIGLMYNGCMLDDSETLALVGRNDDCTVASSGDANTVTIQAIVRKATPDEIWSLLGTRDQADSRLRVAKHTILLGCGVDDNLRSHALNVLVEIGSPAGCDAAVALLEDNQWIVQRSAILILGQIGAPAAPHAKCLLPLLSSQDAKLRNAAAAALQRIGPFSQDEVAEVAALLRNPYVAVRGVAAHLLGEWGSAAVPFSKDLVTACRKDPVNEIRSQAGAALVRIGKVHALASIGAPAAEYAAGMLSDPDSSVRYNAAIALGKIGLPAQSYYNELAALRQDPVEKVRKQAVLSLAELEDAARVPDDITDTVVGTCG